MNHPSSLAYSLGAAILVACLSTIPTASARASSPASPAVIASAVPGQGNDFWEDRFNAMRRIWGTPYVPLGYYWDRVQGLPPRLAPVAPGIYSDRPIYTYGSGYAGYGPVARYGYGPGIAPGYGPGIGYGHRYGHRYGPGIGAVVYPGYGSPYGGFHGAPYGGSYGSPYGGSYGW